LFAILTILSPTVVALSDADLIGNSIKNGFPLYTKGLA